MKNNSILLLSFILCLTIIVNTNHVMINGSIDNPVTLELLSQTEIGATRHVVAYDNYAFVTDFGMTNPLGLVAVNVTDPSNPTITSNCYNGGGAHEMFLDEDVELLYLADHMGGYRNSQH